MDGQVHAHLVAVVHGRDDLPEEVPGFALAQPLPLTDVVIQVSPAGILHDNHNLAAVLKHWAEQGRCQAFLEYTVPHRAPYSFLVPNHTELSL